MDQASIDRYKHDFIIGGELISIMRVRTLAEDELRQITELKGTLWSIQSGRAALRGIATVRVPAEYVELARRIPENISASALEFLVGLCHRAYLPDSYVNKKDVGNARKLLNQMLAALSKPVAVEVLVWPARWFGLLISPPFEQGRYFLLKQKRTCEAGHFCLAHGGAVGREKCFCAMLRRIARASGVSLFSRR